MKFLSSMKNLIPLLCISALVGVLFGFLYPHLNPFGIVIAFIIHMSICGYLGWKWYKICDKFESFTNNRYNDYD